MRYLFIIILLFSCKENVSPELKGTYFADGIELTFDNNILIAKTDYNIIKGQYYTYNDSIRIKISWKKYNNEYDITQLALSRRYELISNKLLLIGENYKLLLYIKN